MHKPIDIATRGVIFYRRKTKCSWPWWLGDYVGDSEMAKAEAKVEELVSMIERGELRLPEMQRQYVWRSTRVRDLLDSLYRGYPSGAILLWETDEAVPLQDFAVQQSGNPYTSVRLLLDGQQRLTSLSAVIRGEPVTVRGHKRPIEILFNLEHPESLSVITEVDENASDDEDLIEDEADSTEDDLQRRFSRMAFVVATKKLEQLPQWIKVSEVFKTDNDAPFLKQAGVLDFDDPRYEKYSNRLARLRGIKKYVYRMDVLERTLSYDEVTEIFVRVNSLGAKLRGSDLALAQISAKWRDSLRLFLDFQRRCAGMGYELDLGIHIKSLIVFATGQSRFLTVPNLTRDQLQTAWADSQPGLEFAINFLKSNAHIESPALLSSPFIVLAVAYLGHLRGFNLQPSESNALRTWIRIANVKGRYSRGSSETILDQDLAVIRQGGGPDALNERLRLQVGRLDITPEELEGRNTRSALFKTMFLAFRAGGARDWHSDLAIALHHGGNQHKLQFHHFFPKAVLKGKYATREADDIANLTFIGGKMNRSIGAKAPAEYVPRLVESRSDAPFRAQCIPLDPSLLTIDRYRQFLAARRQLIAARLNQYLEDRS